MTNVFHSLLLVIAGATQKELARQVKYLKVENEILRGKLPARIIVTPKERNRLVRFAEKLGAKALRQLATIVAPDTLLRWIRATKKDGKKVPAKRSRRRTPEQIRRRFLKLAKENEWGYTRILGELKILGIRLKGIREVFVIAFLNVKTRQVIISPATLHPDEAWVRAAERRDGRRRRLRSTSRSLCADRGRLAVAHRRGMHFRRPSLGPVARDGTSFIGPSSVFPVRRRHPLPDLFVAQDGPRLFHLDRNNPCKELRIA